LKEHLGEEEDDGHDVHDDDGDDGDDGDDVAKAKGRGRASAEGLANSLLSHLVERLGHKRERHGYEKMEKPMTTIAMLIEKHGGITRVCKGIVAARDHAGLTEHDIVQAATAEAQKAFPQLRPDQAFSRFVDANKAVADACTIARQAAFCAAAPKLRAHTDSEYRKAMDERVATLTPRFVGDDKARDVNDPVDALAELNAIVEQQRKEFPFKTTAQLFAQAYKDNPRLAAAERRQNGFSGYPGPDERRRVREGGGATYPGGASGER